MALVRQRETVRVYLDGQLEIETSAPVNFPPDFDRFFPGGRSDGHSNWEGRLDEIAIFDRALSREEVASLIAN